VKFSRNGVEERFMATILIVDDRKLDRELLVTLLRYAQHRVLEAAGATEALRVVKSEHPDLMISDVLLPEIDGYELVRLMRADPAIVQPAVIFYTSVFNEQEARDLALECGVESVLSKPTDPKGILDAVSEVLRSKGIRDTLPMPSDFGDKHRKLLVDKLIEQVDALRRSEERFRLLAENATDMIFRYRLQPTPSWEYVNPAAMAVLGCEPEDFYADRNLLFKIVHPDSRDELRCYMSRGGAAGETTQIRWIRKDGKTVWTEIRGALLSNDEGDVVAFEGIARDITERKQMEEELREARDELDQRVKERTAELESANKQLAISQELSQRTFNEAPIGAAIVALDYRFSRVNDALCRITGYSPEELTSLTIADITHPEDIEATMEQIRRIVAGEIDSYQMEKRYIRKDGSVVWINLSVRMMRDPDGRPLCYFPMMEDITHRKSVEEKLNLYTGRLEESNQALQDFASIASHDLQEPLRKVATFSDRLKIHCGNSLDEQARDYIERMQKATRRMQGLLTSLLDYSRVSTRTEPFIQLDLNDLIRDVLSDLEVRIEQTRGKVEVETLPTVEADPNQIRQVFQNLVSNGLKYIRQGESPLIRIYSECNNNHCRFFVEDKGIGFDEKYLDRIFKPFHRLHGRNEYEGTGIGLAICKKIVERHGGSITARSKPGEGSTFIVTLPLGITNS